MAMGTIICSTFFLFLLRLLLASSTEKQAYIVYFGEHKGDKTLEEIHNTHHSYLLTVKNNDENDARNSLIYSYKHAINGFAATLSPHEASTFSGMEEVLSVIKSYPRKYTLQTTRSWEFLGLDIDDSSSQSQQGNFNNFTNGDKASNFLKEAKFGKGVIVGVVDSGVWPESRSFHDEGMGPVPKRWKGLCQTGHLFNSSNCNRKIIGAKYYAKGFISYFGHVNASEDCLSPRDLDGHGTHVASIISGRTVHNVAGFGGYGQGKATGGAPLAHLAIYKACWAYPNVTKAMGNVCFEEDMLAAMDDAISDGVDVINLSIGTTKPVPFEEDGLAIGALHAMKKDIVVVAAAGNWAPTISNPAPWMITVAASSIDRKFPGSVKLGNGQHFSGETVTPYKMKKYSPLVYAGAVALPNVPVNETDLCLPGSLDNKKVKGKVVLCVRGGKALVLKGSEVKRAGGVGMILGNNKNNGNELSAHAHLLPATNVVYDESQKILDYIKHDKFPTAKISEAKTLLNCKPSPFMGAFSSRGPNVLDPNILKPDITAPGLNILAAWSEGATVSKEATDNRVVKYNFDYGTSMASPHVAAVAALLRAAQPKWSSAAIRSALMTTAGLENNEHHMITDVNGTISNPFQYGSGHVMPIQASNPGLIYDASYKDYLLYLCSIKVKTLDTSFKCPNPSTFTPVNLNYPSIAISKFNGSVSITRIVTNVGKKFSTYVFSCKAPFGVKVEATPSVLIFDEVGQKLSFTIVVEGDPAEIRKANNETDHVFAWYEWRNLKYHVKSPIAISFS
ncbi:hypothetical protein ACFE04_013448 [Oxalis oulophora]